MASDFECIRYAQTRAKDPHYEATKLTIAEFSGSFVGAESLVHAVLNKFDSVTFCVSLLACCVLAFLVLRIVSSAYLTLVHYLYPPVALPTEVKGKYE